MTGPGRKPCEALARRLEGAARRRAERRAAAGKDAGGVIVIVAVTLTVLLGMVAFSVDFGYWLDRAEHLQHAADAAALAGAVEKVNTGGDMSAAEAEARKVLEANGVDPDEVSFSLSDEGAGKVRASVVDNDVQLFFSSLFKSDMSIGRNAEADYRRCGASCVGEYDIPPPFVAINATGAGDGFTPVVVGDRIYAINHKTQPSTNTTMRQLQCADKSTNSICPGYPRFLHTTVGDNGTTGTDVFTNQTPDPVVVGTKIYYPAQRSNSGPGAGRWGVGCWNAASDTSCGWLQLAGLTTPGDSQSNNRGGGLVVVGGNIYAMSDDGKVHCVNPASFTVCTGYPKTSGLPAFNPALNGNRAIPLDAEVVDTKVYWVVHHRATGTTTAAVAQNTVGSRIYCLDTATGATCAGFTGGYQIWPGSDALSYGGSGMIFRRFATNGVTVNGICSHLPTKHKCINLDGTSPVSNPLGNYLRQNTAEMGSTALDIYREFYKDGRTYFPGGWLRGSTICWDWSTSGLCTGLSANPKEWPDAPGAPVGTGPGDYGYTADENCMYGFGHNSQFWSFDENLNPCGGTGVEATIPKCLCTDGGARWGRVRIFDADLTAGSVFASFSITIKAPDSTVLLGPIEMVGTDGTLDLQSIATTYDNLVLDVEVQLISGVTSPWTAGTPPRVEVRVTDVPVLSD
ncbi:MAG: pilus assembly protein TadG-related protein [Acidimicrobiales bacterium]